MIKNEDIAENKENLPTNEEIPADEKKGNSQKEKEHCNRYTKEDYNFIIEHFP